MELNSRERVQCFSVDFTTVRAIMIPGPFDKFEAATKSTSREVDQVFSQTYFASLLTTVPSL